jgi:hypothetical protein
MNSQGGIIRTVKDREHPYRTMNISVLQDNRLSLEARGLLGYLLSKPDDWEVRFTDLLTAAGPNCKEDRLRRILKELEGFGYIQRTRKNVAHGKFEWVTTVFETPQTDNTIMVKPADGKKRTRKPKAPYADFPHMAPYADSSIMVKPADIHSNDLSLSNDKDASADRATPPPVEKQPKTPAPVVTALADVCKIDIKLGTKEQKLQLYSTAKDLYQAGAAAGKTPDEIAETICYVGGHWRTHHWKGKKDKDAAPWPKDIREHWRVAIEARGKNGHVAGDLPLVTAANGTNKQVATPEERRRIIEARMSGK